VIVASGSSNRHVKSIANNVAAEARKAGRAPLGIEGEKEGEWVLVDLGDIIVHVMQRQVREFYDLESLWSVDLAQRREQDVS
jgi:ribosome-associated protein